VGRLKPGNTRAQANADLALLGRQLSADYPDADRNLVPAALPIELVPSPFRGFAGGVSTVLMVVVGLVLLIACGNVANLLLARASGRRREMAVRVALGANRRRLVQQMLTESLVIAGIAGAFGLLLSMWAAPLLLSVKPASVPLALNVSPDLRVLAFTVVASILTAVAFGLAPSLHHSGVNQTTDLKDGSYQGGSAKSRLRSGLVVAQVTACMVLLVGAGLCLRSLFNARAIDPGFDIRDALSASLNVEPFGYNEERGRAYYANLLANVRALPGVRHAGLADHLPLSTITRMEPIEIDGYQSARAASGAPQLAIDMAVVSPGYFDAMGIPLLRGRNFRETDGEAAPAVVIINERMAGQFWPRQDAVGQFVTLVGPHQVRVRARIIGIAKTGKYQTLGEADKPVFYRSLLQQYQPGVQLVVRTEHDVPILGSMREQVRKLDPRIALVDAETLQQHMQLLLFPAQAAGLLLGLFGVLALTLAVAGLYGVIAYSVSQRTREMAVRMALGARPGDVVRLVLWQGLRLTFVGIGIGLAGAFGVTRVLSSILYGISATDPISFVGVALVLSMVALLASYVPARWATSVDPMRALRAE
jgi:macrolide transport system ATP-binding/permease protein